MDRGRGARSLTSAADVNRLVLAAQASRARAYAPYSRYRVGAALLTRAGTVHAGCNVENASFGATLCAERSAVAAMVAAGDCDPVACAVVTAGPRPGAPCGICRQVLFEFAGDLLIVLVAEDPRGKITSRRRVRLRALFPSAFRLKVDR
ncbi:MAG TPA: cytidine deaminase [Polyangiaceae bacterium]|nr:cytidine deaminase [Polyangiaceae bacterium]